MATDAQFDRLVAALGQANRRLQQLTDVDYPSAAYKGFSAQGDTLDEVVAQIDAAQAQVARLEAKLAALDEQDFDE